MEALVVSLSYAQTDALQDEAKRSVQHPNHSALDPECLLHTFIKEHGRIESSAYESGFVASGGKGATVPSAIAGLLSSIASGRLLCFFWLEDCPLLTLFTCGGVSTHWAGIHVCRASDKPPSHNRWNSY